MAVFMVNICKFNGCGITFPSLGDLIQHIEDTHIDYDPLVVEQKEASQPSCIPLSYVLKFFTEATRREFQSNAPSNEVRRKILPIPQPPPSVRSSTPTGSEFDDEDMMTPTEDSNDSWTTAEEYSSDYILRYGMKMSANAQSSNSPQDKPFACPVPGCKKRYKNINGIKYHSKNGHKKDGKVKKAFKCHCGKSYKTSQGLKSHSAQHQIPKQKSLVVTATNSPRNFYDNIDGNKLVRIYDSLKPKDLQAFHIPKITVIKDSSNAGHIIRSQGALTPSTVLATSLDKKKVLDSRPYKAVTSVKNFTGEHSYISKVL